MAGVSASAQDVLITQEGDVKKVYDVEVGPSTVIRKQTRLMPQHCASRKLM